MDPPTIVPNLLSHKHFTKHVLDRESFYDEFMDPYLVFFFVNVLNNNEL